MNQQSPINIFWFRRDLRLHDNAGLYHALNAGLSVLPVFIFDKDILDHLSDKDDARVSFIYQSLVQLDEQLKPHHTSLYILHDHVDEAWRQLTYNFNIQAVYANHDYEPYARHRDQQVEQNLNSRGITLHTYKDQVIFERDELLKADGHPYTIYTPYKRKWFEKVSISDLQSYPSEQYLDAFYHQKFPFPSLKDIGFEHTRLVLPDKNYEAIIESYAHTRDYPGITGTSKIGIHLRFGTASIRELSSKAYIAQDKTWLQELIWREFYMMILWHFPHIIHQAFKSDYDKINWRNNEQEFKAWCEGKTGYAIVDAGMRELNATGWMHNRVRMIVASFLTKHLLIDWRWGEAYFARKLLDYEQASNVGNWQWAAGCGNDAAPYFRIFNPDLQTKKFDPQKEYIKKWVPEFNDPFRYTQPIVAHTTARERVLKVFRQALVS